MGMSIDGILAYGYDLGNEDQWPYDDDERAADWRKPWMDVSEESDTDVAILELLGIEIPVGEYSFSVVNAQDFELVHYGVCDYSSYILTLKDAQVSAYYEAKSVDLTINPEWNKRLKRATDSLGLFPPQNPQWLLAAYYG